MQSEEERNKQWNRDPGNWIWGIFYFNKNDKRLFLPKRNPSFGITVNFANPWAYLFMAGIILLIGILNRL